MKRSEMIDYIYSELVAAIENRKYSNEEDPKYWRRKAAGILDMQLGFGMQPPGHDADMIAITTLNGEFIGKSYEKYEWEPEDEKK